MATFSHSRIGAFEQCPLKYKFCYIDRVPVECEDTVEAFLGSRAHEALEKLYTDLLHEKILSLKELIAYFHKIWKENWNDAIKINKKDYTKDNYIKMGERFLTDYYNHYHPFDQGKVIGLETTDMISLDDKHKFHVRIDRLVDAGNGVYEIHDYKTNNSLSTQADLDSDRQLAAYSLWVHENFKDLKKVRLVWHFLAFDKEMESSRTKEELVSLKKEILAAIHKIESSKKFPAIVSGLCNWCAYQDICPMFKHELKVSQKTVNEFLNDSGVKLVNQYAKVSNELKIIKEEAEEKLEKLKEALILYAKKEGINVIVGSDNKVTVKETSSVSFPAKNTPEREKLIEVLKKMHKFDDVCDLDVFALKHIVEEEEWSAETIEKIGKFMEEKKSVSVRLSKKED